MAIHHSNNTRLKAMDLPHLKATDLLLHKATDSHHPRVTRKLYQPHFRRPFANQKADRRVIQAIHLLREDLHHNQAMVAMVRHLRSSHQGRTVEDSRRYMTSLSERAINCADRGTRHHQLQARATDRLYLEDHSMEGDQVSTSIVLHALSEPDQFLRSSDGTQQRLYPRQSKCPTSTASRPAQLRSRSSSRIQLSILELHRKTQGTVDRDQLLWTKRAAERVHQ